ncbi:MAG: phospholipase D-like domain-containing protein [Gemmatimonadota bacterium]
MPARRERYALLETSGLPRFDADEIERTAGSETIAGNKLHLQFEGSSTFASWLEAIQRAERFVYFENYVIRDDVVGRQFRDALVEKARQGVPVHIVYDWIGCWATPRSYWRPLVAAGAEVHAFNRPSIGLGDPFGVLQRDHRKLICVDGEVAFVGGFCIGVEWAGSAEAAPWRDTGVEIRGPAARAAAVGFERLWSESHEPLELAGRLPEVAPVGDTPVWLIQGEPGRARVYRTLHYAAVRARRRIWITDAYFVAPRAVSEALGAAARDGVDVRILVPAHNNWPVVGSISRGGYRRMLESGVRIFEWQGPMIHAKTSVVDGVWSRIGSSNLNGASLMGNWELDVGVLDRGMAGQLEGLFLADLASSVEIVLPGRVRPGRSVLPTPSEPPQESLEPSGSLPERLEQQWRALGHAPGRLTMASVVRAGFVLGDALAGDRPLGREDRTVLGTLSIAILIVAGVAALWPGVVGWTIALVLGWFGVTTGIRAFLQARRARHEERRGRETAKRSESESTESKRESSGE